MKKLIYTFLSIFMISSIDAQEVSDTVVMGTNYSNDVFYSLENDDVMSVSRTNWDLAFFTDPMTVGVYTNGAAGVDLYFLPNADTSDWLTLDTSGFYMLQPRQNILKMWGDSGAFNIETKGGAFSYGWGVYNIVNHKIVGNVLYLIKLQDATLKKIWIVEKNAPMNTYTFKYANLDGTDEQTVNLTVNPHKSKNFIYYSISNNMEVDRDPASDSWQLLFTKYVDKVNFGPGMVDYPVTGILTNNDVYVAEVTDVNQVTYDDYKSHEFDSTFINVIGSDWKKTIGMPPVYDIDDSLVYFIATQEGDVWKMYFTDFESGSGGGDGKFMFNKQKIFGSSSINDEAGDLNILSVYPNPVSGNEISVIYRVTNPEFINLTIYDLNGKLMYKEELKSHAELNVHKFNHSFKPGLYLVNIESPALNLTQKLIVK